MKTFDQFLKESIIDLPRSTLSGNVFDLSNPDNPVLLSKTKKHIESILEKYEKIAPILEVHLIGSILTLRYADDADLDLNVLFDVAEKDQEDVDKKLKELNKEYNGKPLPWSKNPVNLFIMYDREKFGRADKLADGVFDVKENKFIRKPTPQKFNIDDYMDGFRSAIKKIDLNVAELKRDIVDYEVLKNLESEEIEGLKKLVTAKLKEIQQDSEDLISDYVNAHEARKNIFSKDLSPEEIRKYGTKNKMPQNVIYKLMEKYHYGMLLKKLDEIVNNKKKITDDDVKKIKTVLKKF